MAGVPGKGGPRIYPRHTEVIARLYIEEHLSTRAIAARLRFSRSKVQHHLRLAGVEMRGPGRVKQ